MIRVKLRSWTASFRYPTFQAGYQPSLPVPPLSTILGLLSAAKGDIVGIEDVDGLGYIFKSEGNGKDLEKIHALGKPETDIMKREILFDNTLYLYLHDEWKRYFKKPEYQLLLGRSSDLATVEEIKKFSITKRKKVPIGGTIVPIKENVPGIVHALTVEFIYDKIPRTVKTARPFIVVPFPKRNAERKAIIEKEIIFDSELELGVYLYDKTMFS